MGPTLVLPTQAPQDRHLGTLQHRSANVTSPTAHSQNPRALTTDMTKPRPLTHPPASKLRTVVNSESRQSLVGRKTTRSRLPKEYFGFVAFGHRDFGEFRAALSLRSRIRGFEDSKLWFGVRLGCRSSSQCSISALITRARL